MDSVNILIPTYNQAEHLAHAVQSALDQDYGNLRVIVSDDASTDTTASVLERFSADERLLVNRNPHNLGRVGNYRKCLYELAFGEWILVLDGDDYLCDNAYISNAIEIASNNPSIDLVFANAARLREDLDNQLQASSENQGLPGLMDGRDLFLRLATERISLFHNTCLYKREKACSLDFYRQDIISSDWESLHRYILTGRVAYCAIDAAVWRLHGNNATKTLSAAQSIANLSCITGPYQAAKAGRIFPQQVLENWFEARLWNIAAKDVRALLKKADFESYQTYMATLQRIHPVVFKRIRRSPGLLMRKLRARLR
tara:strand:+ start:3854 stop:4795 length:942 start_codon:yes stop_codon:yes gene_type:complete